MKNSTLLLLFILMGSSLNVIGQKSMDIIDKSETERIEKYLSSNELEGRKTFSKGIDKAADFIANEFKQSNLATLQNSNSYLQKFTRLSAKFINATANFDGTPIEVAVKLKERDDA